MMDDHPYSVSHIQHLRSRLIDFEQERAVFLMRFESIKRVLNEQYEQEIEAIDDEHDIATTIHEMNNFKLSQLEEHKSLIETEGDSFHLKGKMMENRNKLTKLLEVTNSIDQTGKPVGEIFRNRTRAEEIDLDEPFLKQSYVKSLPNRPRMGADGQLRPGYPTPSRASPGFREQKKQEESHTPKSSRRLTPRHIRETTHPVETFHQIQDQNLDSVQTPKRESDFTPSSQKQIKTPGTAARAQTSPSHRITPSTVRRISSNSRNSPSTTKRLPSTPHTGNTPVFVPAKERRTHLFDDDNNYDDLMDTIAKLEEERKEKLHVFEVQVLALLDQRQRLADELEHKTHHHHRELHQAIDQENEARQHLLQITYDYLSSRLDFQIRQRVLIEQRELLRESSFRFETQISSLQSELAQQASDLTDAFDEETRLRVIDLKQEIEETSQIIKQIEEEHQSHTVNVLQRRIERVESERDSFERKDSELRRRWRLEREGLENGKKDLLRKITHLQRIESQFEVDE
ncbi:hypothetical protein BLNAU_12531 [Blattamonas nauphoetae]|uniref:Uncharacterized protein n=1 Tax=Blattamonas nauphoetae TaxID=2049346 RepID=A0ABQ9XM52_9EUKA|nr:hypothetical protein BLNAU_12531 [Blattamonas nauphoetae]